jgi:vacuolar-type H+-ATPase subunit C/Vma6
MQPFPFCVTVLLTHRQEIRNITWIAECIAQNQKDRIGNYISVF